MLGDAVWRHFSRTDEVVATDIVSGEAWLGYCDVRNFHSLRTQIEEWRPDIIMNLAAMTDLEECEQCPGRAYDTNTGGSANLAALADEFGATYVYVSTAGIFDGEQESYADGDVPRPLSTYGRAKYYGERIAQALPRHFVVRPGWMMGGGPRKDKKFINKVFKQLQAGATEINAVADKGGTPTYTHDLARNIDVLLRSGKHGTYNCTCLGSTTRHEVAAEFVRLLGLSDRVRVNPVTSDFFVKEGYTAARPASEHIRSERLDAEGLNVMRPWKECLEEYSKEYL